MERTDIITLKSAEKLDTDTRLALPLFEEYEFSVQKNENGEPVLQIKDFFECTLTLTDAVAEPAIIGEEKIDAFAAELKEEEGRLCFSLVVDVPVKNGEGFDCSELKLLFTEAHAEFNTVYNLFDFGTVTSAPNPWLHIGEVCHLLKKKALANGKLLNEKERELLPLACFVADIAAQQPGKKTEYSQAFVELAGKCKDEKAVELIERRRVDDGKFVAVSAIAIRLTDARHEKLWRKIHALLLDSQKDYPARPSEGGAQEKIENTRKAISKTLREQGFEGEYPSFFKKIDVKCATAMFGGQAVTVLHEKNVSCFVHILERLSGEESFFAALSGTMLFEKGREENDIFSCCFSSRKRRRCVCTGFSLSKTTCEIFSFPETAEELALIAAKRAELKKLSKSEKKHVASQKHSVSYYIMLALFFGFLFAALFTPLMALYTSIIDKVPLFEELKDPLWFEIFVFGSAFSGGLFALAMAAVDKAFGKR